MLSISLIVIISLGLLKEVHGGSVVLYGDQACTYGASDTLSGGALFSADVGYNCLAISQDSELGGAWAAKGFTSDVVGCTFKFYSSTTCTSSSLMHTINTASTACTCLDMSSPVAGIRVTCGSSSKKRGTDRDLFSRKELQQQKAKRSVCNINLQADEAVWSMPDRLLGEAAGGTMFGITDVQVEGDPLSIHPPLGDALNTLVVQTFAGLLQDADETGANTASASFDHLYIEINTRQYTYEGQTGHLNVRDLLVHTGRTAMMAQITAALNRMVTEDRTSVIYDIRLFGVDGPVVGTISLDFS